MKLCRMLLCFLAASLAAAACFGTEPDKMQDRWFYAAIGLGTDAQVDELISLVERAGDSGLNAMLWATSWDSCGRWSKDWIQRLERVKKACKKNNVEIVPILWSIGYGTMLSKDPNLAEGLPIVDLPMTAQGGKIVYVPETAEIENGDMEEWNNKKLAGYSFHDRPGEVSFRDDKIAHNGKTSIRFENLEDQKHGHGRLLYEAKLIPGRVYEASCWFKAENFQGSVLLQVYDSQGEQKATGKPKFTPDAKGLVNSDWVQAHTIFQVPEDGAAKIYMGCWEGKKGKLWVDELEVKPLGLVNPLRREGTPIVVKSEDGKTVYKEGKDWELGKFQLSPWKQDSPSQKLTILKGSKIKDGQKVLVDFYYPPLVGAPQIGTCMSEPKVYEYFEESAKAVKKLIDPKKWFLSMDEIRCAGTCKACVDRGISLAEILGDCVTKQYDIIKSAAPGAEVYIWSDMLDPNHNAHDNYYVCRGDYTGVWDLVPKDLIISCWYYEKREASMKFFSERGFRTQAAAYYDTDDLKNCEDWYELCKRTPKCTGIMYTTWRAKYKLLEDFGKLVDPKTGSKTKR